MTTAKMSVNDTVQFTLINSVLSQASYKNCIFQGIVTYKVALNISQDINSKHLALYPYFKDKYPNIKSASDYQYYLILLPSGEMTAIGAPWIMESTIEIVTNQSCTIRIYNYSDSMNSPLVDLLNNLGASYEIDIENTAYN